MSAVKVKALGPRGLFLTKKENLMKRVGLYFEQTQNTTEVVEYLVAILLRNAVCVGDYSLDQLIELIHQIFLTTEPNDTLRRHCVFFQRFFSAEDWQKILHRLFKNDAEYAEFTKETSVYNEYLEKREREIPSESDYQSNIISIFLDGNGKKHTWTLRDTKAIPKGADDIAREVAEVLKIMTTLTIFQVNGVRRYAECVHIQSDESRNNVKLAVSDPAIAVQTSIPSTKSTPAPSINSSKTAKKTSSPVSQSTPNRSAEGAVKANSPIPVPEDDGTVADLKSCSAAPNPQTIKNPSAEKAVKPQPTDPPYEQEEKNEEQNKKSRKDKKRNNNIDKALRKRGWGGEKKRKKDKKKK